MLPSDQDVMAAVQQRDAVAFETLVKRYGDLLRRHILRMVRDEATAGDLLQLTLMRVWERASQWRGQGALKSWLLRIATNQALNHLDALRRRREQPLEVPRENMRYGDDGDDDQPVVPRWLIDPDARPDLDIEQAEQTDTLQNLVDALPPEKQTVFYMANQTGLELREIADKLGVPEGTVKSRLHYTMKTLMEQWKELDNEEISL